MLEQEVIVHGVNELKLPKYIRKILDNVKSTGTIYQYRLCGTNRYRPSYGIYDDMEKLKKWVEQNYAECSVIKYNTTPNNYYVDFKLTDPVAFMLERVGI